VVSNFNSTEQIDSADTITTGRQKLYESAMPFLELWYTEYEAAQDRKRAIHRAVSYKVQQQPSNTESGDLTSKL